MRLETQLGGILSSTLTGESKKPLSFNKFLSYATQGRSILLSFVAFLTKLWWFSEIPARSTTPIGYAQRLGRYSSTR
jgi:hypothetical protein